ncbi:LapA family protein [Novosphingobium sp. Leaf2]|uniref:LapA family protein n=1 Tax=Novosphingobium sp. Leaf2 TaxID=1735670 RepID=UPI000B234EC9|nr:LapA family protein [Novosphingobium sp. Leaf2]
MQIIRTITWVLLTAVLVAFIAMNWTKAPINFWPLQDGNYLHFDWPVGVVALLFFGLGMLPVWLYLRAVRWRLERRIATLENSLRATSSPGVGTPGLGASPADHVVISDVAKP